MKIGWLVAPDAISGTKVTSENLKSAAPDDIEVINYDPAQPTSCDGYVVHTSAIPQNLPVFPSLKSLGSIIKKKPVILYSHSWGLDVVGSDIVIYQSPGHESTHKLGTKSYVVPPYIIPSEYEKADGVERMSTQLWVGNFGEPTNGADIAIRKAEHHKRMTHFYGWGVPVGSQSTYCQFFPAIDHADMPKLYQSYENLIFYPRRPSPFSRHIAEALLNGCEVTMWGTVGIETFDRPITEVLELCKRAGEDFWNIVKTEVA